MSEIATNEALPRPLPLRRHVLRDGDQDEARARRRASGDRHLDADSLTPQERRTARHLLRGHGPQQAACDLRLSVRTVYWHTDNVYRKTRSHSLGEFFGWAYRHRHCCHYAELFEDPRP